MGCANVANSFSSASNYSELSEILENENHKIELEIKALSKGNLYKKLNFRG